MATATAKTALLQRADVACERQVKATKPADLCAMAHGAGDSDVINSEILIRLGEISVEYVYLS